MTFYFISLGAHWGFCDGLELETGQKTEKLAVPDQSLPSGLVTAQAVVWLLRLAERQSLTS